MSVFVVAVRVRFCLYGIGYDNGCVGFHFETFLFGYCLFVVVAMVGVYRAIIVRVAVLFV